ncbi:MAG: aminoglycoside phosphotransferase family protein [Oscillospiraceae bacterium]|nr:aminoglycoside phosphotransferase family protein [Oscillospiraceae bacterium]
MVIDERVARRLIHEQFPEWADLPVRPIAKGGNDNRTFRLGDHMLMRLPSSEGYAPQAEKEWAWLPKLGRHLSLPITSPLARGAPTAYYPFPWTVTGYIVGEAADDGNVGDKVRFAYDLAGFLKELQAIDTAGAPLAGPHNFHRGGDLSVYDGQAREAFRNLADRLPTGRLSAMWDAALGARWDGEGVWVHGDVAVSNLMVREGSLCGVIDFGIMGVGDPACDYVMAWTFFDGPAKRRFLEALGCDGGTMDRARGWALWKAAISYDWGSGDYAREARHTIDAILRE